MWEVTRGYTSKLPLNPQTANTATLKYQIHRFVKGMINTIKCLTSESKRGLWSNNGVTFEAGWCVVQCRVWVEAAGGAVWGAQSGIVLATSNSYNPETQAEAWDRCCRVTSVMEILNECSEVREEKRINPTPQVARKLTKVRGKRKKLVHREQMKYHDSLIKREGKPAIWKIINAERKGKSKQEKICHIYFWISWFQK